MTKSFYADSCDAVGNDHVVKISASEEHIVRNFRYTAAQFDTHQTGAAVKSVDADFGDVIGNDYGV